MAPGLKRPGAPCNTEARGRLEAELPSPTPLPEAMRTICWPVEPSKSSYCKTLQEELEELGVKGVYNYGAKRVAGARVLGRGWSSIVVLAETSSGTHVAKIARPRGRRATLLWEAVAWTVAAGLRVAPRIHGASLHAILVEYIPGPGLGDYRPRSCWEAWLVLRRVLVKTHLLDRARLRHGELARPHSHVLLDYDLEPFIVDYESSRVARKPGNTSQLLAGLQAYPWARKAFPALASPAGIREILRRHRENPTAEALEELLEALGEPADEAC